MSFRDSYLGRLRERIGPDLVLMPGAMVVVQREDGRILVTRRGDNGEWCLPAGAAEVGGSFATTAVAELAEEVGLSVAVDDLIAFGSLSGADTHTIRYPNGDVTHCFALLFRSVAGREIRASTARKRSKRGSSSSESCPAP